MFRKRQKTQYPPGTFIPTPARVCAIIQLSLAFVIIAWNASQPFMGELFDYKSRLLLFQDAMGISPLSAKEDNRVMRLLRNEARFNALPLQQQQRINAEFQSLNELSQRTFLTKLQRSLHILVFDIPAFEQAWLLLSIIIPILLLKRIEGATQVIWLLPLLTVLYAWDNQQFGATPSPSSESRLFPSEKEIVDKYMDRPLSTDISQQRAELMQGWKRYLIHEWTTESESATTAEFELQSEEGEFAFNIARIEALSNTHVISSMTRPQKERLSCLALYLFWNFFFAFSAGRQINTEKRFAYAETLRTS